MVTTFEVGHGYTCHENIHNLGRDKYVTKIVTKLLCEKAESEEKKEVRDEPKGNQITHDGLILHPHTTKGLACDFAVRDPTADDAKDNHGPKQGTQDTKGSVDMCVRMAHDQRRGLHLVKNTTFHQHCTEPNDSFCLVVACIIELHDELPWHHLPRVLVLLLEVNNDIHEAFNGEVCPLKLSGRAVKEVESMKVYVDTHCLELGP